MLGVVRNDGCMGLYNRYLEFCFFFLISDLIFGA
jgi:hypothetical protein